MLRVNGLVNEKAARAAALHKVSRFVYVSAVESNLPSFVLPGYFQGKRAAEAAVLANFPATDGGGAGFVLRPSFVFGDRAVGYGISLPLWLVGRPLQTLFSLSPLRALRRALPGMQAVLAPPVSVEDVALVAAALSCSATAPSSVLSPEDIIALAR